MRWELCLPIIVLFAYPTVAAEPAVWTGLTYDFVHADGGDPEEPENQDPISSNVILTRDVLEGLFNIAKEPAYATHTSPAGTLWATDINNPGEVISASNWEALEFTTWRSAYGDAVFFNILDRSAVLLLVKDNVYLDIQFSSWTSSFGGGFAYSRAEGELPPPPPTGDYNDDGVVNAADYTVWRNTLGQSVSVLGAGADGDCDGMIDTGDYEFWKQHFGEVVSGGAGGGGIAAVVPEPSAMLLMLVGLLAVRMHRK